jgi:hypothetical protein
MSKMITNGIITVNDETVPFVIPGSIEIDLGQVESEVKSTTDNQVILAEDFSTQVGMVKYKQYPTLDAIEFANRMKTLKTASRISVTNSDSDFSYTFQNAWNTNKITIPLQQDGEIEIEWKSEKAV